MDKFSEIMNKVLEVLKRIGAVIVDVCKRAWELVRKYAPIAWAAICRFCTTVWAKTKSATAKLLDVDEQLNKRAVNVALCSFAAIIVLFILVLAT
ncbi:MAG: hypothetical protein IJM56_03295 [Clostridia bacterium]|nr:hypothetical protein [Clostridia bacterium]